MRGMRIVIIVLGGIVVLLSIIMVILRYTGSSEDENSNTTDNQNTTVNENINQSTNVNSNSNGNTNTVANINTVPTNTNSDVNINVNTNTSTPISSGEASLRTIARSFAERFGTYSTHSDFENIADLLPYMTNHMKVWATDYLEEMRSKPIYTGIYSGTTTKALTVKTVEYNDSGGAAEFLIGTQRKESTGSTSNARIYNQDIQIKFLKEQSIWKVDEAWWQ